MIFAILQLFEVCFNAFQGENHTISPTVKSPTIFHQYPCLKWENYFWSIYVLFQIWNISIFGFTFINIDGKTIRNIVWSFSLSIFCRCLNKRKNYHKIMYLYDKIVPKIKIKMMPSILMLTHFYETAWTLHIPHLMRPQLFD